MCDHGFSVHPWDVWLVGPILAPEPDQNQPLICLGCKWGASQPWKLHSRPEVHRELTLYWTQASCSYILSKLHITFIMSLSTIRFSSGVSIDIRSMHIERQILRASSQLALKKDYCYSNNQTYWNLIFSKMRLPREEVVMPSPLVHVVLGPLLALLHPGGGE